MWWIILIILILFLVASIIDALHFVYIGIIDFFVNTTWGILTLIAGILSLALFYASSKSYKDVKFNESFLPNPDRLLKHPKKGKEVMADSHNNSGEIPEFDLSSLTMETFVKKMAFELNKPGPVFFKGWGNERLKLDVERVQIIQRYIDSIRETGISLMHLQADAFLSYKKIDALTKQKSNDLKKLVQKSADELDFSNREYQHRVKMMEIAENNAEEDVKMKRVLREQIETQNTVEKLRAEAEYKLLMAKGTEKEQIALILAEAVSYYKDLPDILKSYVAVQLGSEHSQNPEGDMVLQEQLKDIIIRKHSAEAKKLESEADESEALKEMLKVKLEKEKKKYLGNG